jgi:hypothetical protein
MRRAICFFVVWAGFVGVAAAAAPDSGVVTTADLEQALLAHHESEAAARATLRSLLARQEVRRLAAGAGIDLRQADAAVATLEGAELRELESLALTAQSDLAGGDPTIRISLIAALLIIIIVILLVK